MSATEAYVFEALRTPRGKGKKGGALYGTKPLSLVVGLIDELRSRLPGLAHRQDADRRPRQARLLHQPRHRHLPQRGPRAASGRHAPGEHRAGQRAGRLPAPVLQLLDELSLTLSRTVREQTRSALRAAGQTPVAHPGDVVIDRMVLELDRGGRAAGAGFYEYVVGARTRLWPGLLDAFGGRPHAVPFEDAQELLFDEALETVRCVDEGVLTSVADANVGSILGIGFPAWTGGVAQYVEQYDGGVAGFVARADQLADAYGERF